MDSSYSTIHQLVMVTMYTTCIFGVIAVALGGFRFDPKGFAAASFGALLGLFTSALFVLKGASDSTGIFATILNGGAGISFSTIAYVMTTSGRASPIWKKRPIAGQPPDVLRP